MSHAILLATVANLEREVIRLRKERDELRRLLANATDPLNAGDWDEARVVGWAHLVSIGAESGPATDEQRLACGWCGGEGAIRDQDDKLGEDCPRCHGASKLSPAPRDSRRATEEDQ